MKHLKKHAEIVNNQDVAQHLIIRQQRFNFQEFDFQGFKDQASDFFTGGIRDSYQNVRNGQGLFEAISNAHKNENGTVNMMRAAGTFVTASARVASGGGLYKDRYGNPNLIGVPFI